MVAYERSFDGRKGVKFIVGQLLTLDNVCCKRQRLLSDKFFPPFFTFPTSFPELSLASRREEERTLGTRLSHLPFVV